MTTRQRWLSGRAAALSLVAWVILAGGDVRAALIIVPNALATTEGNENNGFPFNIGPFESTSMRYQQVYAASQFGSFGAPLLITAIAFRPDAQPGPGSAFTATLPDVQIDLSTTPRLPDGLSPTFAANVGADDTLVRSGPLPLASAFIGPPSGPKAFDIGINLMTPFLYDPAAGNLLLDVRNFAGGTTTQFDAVRITGDPVSRAVASGVGVNSPVANLDLVDTIGLVTQFTVTPVPEPASLVLLGLGLVGVAGLARRARARRDGGRSD